MTAPHVHHIVLNLKSNARLRREAVPNTTFCGEREFTHDDEFSLINSLSKKKARILSLRIQLREKSHTFNTFIETN